MKKNILIIGAPRSGKTTLSRKLCKEQGYNIISLDDIICAFEEYPSLGIRHDYDNPKVAERFAPFLVKYLKELSEGSNFYDGIKYVIEGAWINFEKIMKEIDKEKYIIIGLTYNNATPEKMYNNIRKYDTEDEWTYYCTDEKLNNNINYFIEVNKKFNELFKEYSIESYDIDSREDTLNQIIEKIKNENID